MRVTLALAVALGLLAGAPCLARDAATQAKIDRCVAERAAEMFSVGGNPGISVRIGCVSRYDRPAVDAYNARGLAAWKASVECAKTAPRDVCDARFYPVKLP